MLSSRARRGRLLPQPAPPAGTAAAKPAHPVGAESTVPGGPGRTGLGCAGGAVLHARGTLVGRLPGRCAHVDGHRDGCYHGPARGSARRSRYRHGPADRRLAAGRVRSVRRAAVPGARAPGLAGNGGRARFLLRRALLLAAAPSGFRRRVRCGTCQRRPPSGRGGAARALPPGCSPKRTAAGETGPSAALVPGRVPDVTGAPAGEPAP